MRNVNNVTCVCVCVSWGSASERVLPLAQFLSMHNSICDEDEEIQVASNRTDIFLKGTLLKSIDP